eukprot:TRINITY_DN9997_c0_g2_i1.p1 TRINITY_DN9997_c0_g2~~TRINITY_DN9997_c0_g2_i1.p1  ORF type:complete len:1358 (+),score=404.64 TRINITY_DN9997_c0_g2_i1:66-4139(+)
MLSMLTLQVDRGWNLLGVEECDGPRPYTTNAVLVVSRAADGSGELCRTDVCRASSSPKWEAVLSAEVPGPLTSVWLTAYHAGSDGADVFIGCGELDVAGGGRGGGRDGSEMVNLGPRPHRAAEDADSLSSPVARNRGNYGCVDVSWEVAEREVEALPDDPPAPELLPEDADPALMDAPAGDDSNPFPPYPGPPDAQYTQPFPPHTQQDGYPAPPPTHQPYPGTAQDGYPAPPPQMYPTQDGYPVPPQANPYPYPAAPTDGYPASPYPAPPQYSAQDGSPYPPPHDPQARYPYPPYQPAPAPYAQPFGQTPGVYQGQFGQPPAAAYPPYPAQEYGGGGNPYPRQPVPHPQQQHPQHPPWEQHVVHDGAAAAAAGLVQPPSEALVDGDEQDDVQLVGGDEEEDDDVDPMEDVPHGVGAGDEGAASQATPSGTPRAAQAGGAGRGVEEAPGLDEAEGEQELLQEEGMRVEATDPPYATGDQTPQADARPAQADGHEPTPSSAPQSGACTPRGVAGEDAAGVDVADVAVVVPSPADAPGHGQHEARYVIKVLSVVAVGGYRTPLLAVSGFEGPGGEALLESAVELSSTPAEDFDTVLPTRCFETRVQWESPVVFTTPGLPCRFHVAVADQARAKGGAVVEIPEVTDARWADRRDLGEGSRAILLEYPLVRNSMQVEVAVAPLGAELCGVPDDLLSALNDDAADLDRVASLADFYSQQKKAERRQVQQDRKEDAAKLLKTESMLRPAAAAAATAAAAAPRLGLGEVVAVSTLTLAVGILILLEDDPDELLPLLTIGHEHVVSQAPLPSTQEEVTIPAAINEILNTRIRAQDGSAVVDEQNKWLVCPYEYHCPGQPPIAYSPQTQSPRSKGRNPGASAAEPPKQAVRYIVRPPTKLDYNSPLYSNILGGAKVQRFYANLVCGPQTATVGIETDLSMDDVANLEEFQHHALEAEEEEDEEGEESEEGDGVDRRAQSMTSSMRSNRSRAMSRCSRSSRGSVTSRTKSAFSTGDGAAKVTCPSPHCGLENFIHVKTRRKNCVKEVKYCGHCGCHLNTEKPDGVMDEYMKMKEKVAVYEKEMAIMEAKLELLVKSGGPAAAESSQGSRKQSGEVKKLVGKAWGAAGDRQMEYFTGRKTHGVTRLQEQAAKKQKQKLYQRRLEKDLRHYAAHMTRVRTALYDDTSALFTAAERGDTTPFQKLKRVDPEMGQLRDIIDGSGRTPLNIAAIHGHYAILSCVFKPIQTSDPEERVQSEDTLVSLCFPAQSGAASLLHSAVFSGKLNVVELVVHRFVSHPRFPALFNVKTKAGQSVMDLAHARQQAHISRYLEDQEKLCQRRRALKYTGSGGVASPTSPFGGYSKFLGEEFA